ncbi:IclR family transcriptional regulator [Truepera radiovictrix]|uniref:Transcriptional regulator, IclR family n=1 Tax=Truepera radiovictrix (strain DSM 17093 / CIP 108686 / LMG 22925 / RQ-24) TaxID=649638 RepID=D7CUQ9_TRURR|nr:helix-turn-helix domain-containing protein [Truepera radiovictrix]ADI14050.1 transcriptional regulator, IclR family [Truepera radiovictrix DSM 17093]WMT57389.1 IclR family transcriptional regulator C-terminal domain-containing protein [Truepera radiovictrix]
MRSLAKASAVLAAFRADRPEWGPRALALHLGLPRATVHAHLAALTEVGLLRRVARGRYRLSWRLAELAAQLTDALPFLPRARLALAELAARERALAYVCVLEDRRVVCVARTLGDPAAGDALQTDVVLPTHATAAGKLLYAFAGLTPPALTPYTASTITTPDEWASELARVLELGYARAVEEWLPGQCALAAPLLWEGGVAAALGLQLPLKRFLAREKRLVTALRAAAESVSLPPSVGEAGAAAGAL